MAFTRLSLLAERNTFMQTTTFEKESIKINKNSVTFQIMLCNGTRQ